MGRARETFSDLPAQPSGPERSACLLPDQTQPPAEPRWPAETLTVEFQAAVSMVGSAAADH